MGTKTNFLENELVDHIFRGAAYIAPATLYFGLATAVTDAKAGTLTEVTGGGYARVGVTPNGTNFGAPTTGDTDNLTAITFPTPTGNWSTGVNITHMFIADAASAGNILHIQALTTPKAVLNGQQAPSIPIGSFTYNEDA